MGRMMGDGGEIALDSCYRSVTSVRVPIGLYGPRQIGSQSWN